jgi:hypothetical protein
MKYFVLVFIFILLQANLIAQIDSTFFNSFLVLTEDNLMKIEASTGSLIYQKQFYKPYEYLANIDGDQFDELIIVDSIMVDDNLSFTIYLFSGEENFQLIDSILSGSFFPFISYSAEINSMIIETGISDFDKFNQTSEVSSLPINLWKIENDELLLVNDDLYEPFIFENANLVQLLDFYAHEKGFSCSTSQFYKGVVVSAFTNYINAGEQSLATNMLKKYYLCDDIELFKQEIIDLIFPEAKE